MAKRTSKQAPRGEAPAPAVKSPSITQQLLQSIDAIAAARGWTLEDAASGADDVLALNVDSMLRAEAAFSIRYLVEMTQIVASALCGRVDGDFGVSLSDDLANDIEGDLFLLRAALTRASHVADSIDADNPSTPPEIVAAFMLGMLLAPLWGKVEMAHKADMAQFEKCEQIIRGKLSGWHRRLNKQARKNADRQRLLTMCLHDGLGMEEALGQLMQERKVTDCEYFKKRIGWRALKATLRKARPAREAHKRRARVRTGG